MRLCDPGSAVGVCDHFVISAAMHCQMCVSEERGHCPQYAHSMKNSGLTLLFKPFPDEKHAEMKLTYAK